MLRKDLRVFLLVITLPGLVIGPFGQSAHGAAPPPAVRIAGGILAQLVTDCDLYVAPDGIGDDANSGTSPHLPKTLLGAEALTSDTNNVVCLLGGRYEFHKTWQLTNRNNTTRIKYIAYNDGPVLFVAAADWPGLTGDPRDPMIKVQGTYNGVSYAGARLYSFEGLVLDGQDRANSGFQCRQSWGLSFIGNTLVNLDGGGIVTTECDYLISDHNLVFHNGSLEGLDSPSGGLSNTSGISYGQVPWKDSYTGIHNAITNNIIVSEVDDSSDDTDGNGIILDLAWGLNTDTPPALILNNLVYGNGGRCIITNRNVKNFWIVNNTCYKNNLDQPNFGGIAHFDTTDASGFVVNNIVSSWQSTNPPYQQGNASGIAYRKNLYFGASCSPSEMCDPNPPFSFINGDPQFVAPPYFDPAKPEQYKYARPPLPGRPIYRSTTWCGVAEPTQRWIPTCEITSGFALAPTSPAYGNIGIDPISLTTDQLIEADLATYVYVDINGNPRGGATGKWDLGAHQH
jgi:hypothetical protein